MACMNASSRLGRCAEHVIESAPLKFAQPNASEVPYSASNFYEANRNTTFKSDPLKLDRDFRYWQKGVRKFP